MIRSRVFCSRDTTNERLVASRQKKIRDFLFKGHDLNILFT